MTDRSIDDQASMLSERLVDFSVSQLDARAMGDRTIVSLPAVSGGHHVGDDARIEMHLMFAYLQSFPQANITRGSVREDLLETLRGIRPYEIDGYSSYRLAEATRRVGGLEAVPAWTHPILDEATYPHALLRDLQTSKRKRHVNYYFVAARCLHERQLLDMGFEEGFAQYLRAEINSRMGGAVSGWIDDGRDHQTRYDIYSFEDYLLSEAYAEEIGPLWEARVAALVESSTPLMHQGHVVSWGRSIGPLALAMTLEFGPLACRAHPELARRWLQQADIALLELSRWFSGGLTSAHQGRGTDPYRGLSRRVQMTFDLLGKLVRAATRFRDLADAGHLQGSHEGVEYRTSFGDTAAGPARGRDSGRDSDRLIWFSDDGSNACIWTVGHGSQGFELPMLYGDGVGYLPSPRRIGVFEPPASEHCAFLPALYTPVGFHGSQQLQDVRVPQGLPTSIDHEPCELRVGHSGWSLLGRSGPAGEPISGGRRARYEVRGRSLRVTEELEFTDLPQRSTVAVAIPSTGGCPLRVSCTDGEVVESDVTDVAEWRSYWGGPRTLHEIVVPAEPVMRFTWEVQAALRIASSDLEHDYCDALYRHMPHTSALGTTSDRQRLAATAAQVDVFHLNWPERWCGSDPELARQCIEILKAAGTAIVWTQHNLVPHKDRSPEARATYAMWAQAADLVIHHSLYGYELASATLPYAPDTIHEIIPHGHWGHHYGDQVWDRVDVESDEGWPNTGIRFGVFGQPRRGKQLQETLESFQRVDRQDVQLVIRLPGDVAVPDDPRVIPIYGHVDRDRYCRRVSACDALVFPFGSTDMLATGTVFDSLGSGIPAVISRWRFLTEMLGSVALTYEGSSDGFASLIEGLSESDLSAARARMMDHRTRFEWGPIGARTVSAMDRAFDAVHS